MTLGVAVLMDTGVVLVADGRVTNALDARERMAEGFQKIRLVQPKVAAVIGGVALASARAADHLSASSSRDAADVVTAAAQGLNIGWHLLQETHPAEFASHQRHRERRRDVLDGGRSRQRQLHHRCGRRGPTRCMKRETL